MTEQTIQSYPLTWPDGRKRTPLRDRHHNNSWKQGTQRYRQHLLEQLEKMRVERVIISTNKPLRLDGHFRADSPEPQDGGVAIYFDYKKKPMCLACDKYFTVEDNIHAIGLTLEAIRSIERNGSTDLMEQAFKGFTALPEQSSESWREILDLQQPRPTADEIESAFRKLVHIHHPDKGGDAEKFHQIVLARENARKDIGVTR